MSNTYLVAISKEDHDKDPSGNNIETATVQFVVDGPNSGLGIDYVTTINQRNMDAHADGYHMWLLDLEDCQMMPNWEPAHRQYLAYVHTKTLQEMA